MNFILMIKYRLNDDIVAVTNFRVYHEFSSESWVIISVVNFYHNDEFSSPNFVLVTIIHHRPMIVQLDGGFSS